MKNAAFVAVLFVLSSGFCLHGDPIRTLSHGVAWAGSASVTFSNETFAGCPIWREGVEPSVGLVTACQLAESYIAKNKPDLLNYRLDSIYFCRYFDTDWWYYIVSFEALVKPGDQSWQSSEPYSTLITKGLFQTNAIPRLGVGVLLTGAIVVPKIEE